MARISTLWLQVICLLFVLCTLFPENEASWSIPVPGNFRIQSPQGRKCLNFLWNRPCDHPFCKITLKIKLQKDGSSLLSQIASYKPAITNNNASFVQCIYDSSAGENVSCCNSANPGVVLTSGYSLSFSNYENIRFDIRTCLNDSGNCVLKNELSFILPWYNPCFFSNPCLDHGKCVPAVKNYNCSCDVDWKGDNCSIPKDMTYHAGKCLDSSSDADVKHYMRTVGGCRMSCLFMGSSKCKSFELKKMATGNHGNCTFRNSNSRAQKLTQCEADLYELTKYLNPSSAPSVGIVALHLLLMLLATVFLKE